MSTESPKSLNALTRGTHALATVSHPDAHVYRVGILLQPHLPEGTPPNATGIASNPNEESRELGEVCAWTAQVRLGSGEWGGPVGYGKEPEDALAALFHGYRRRVQGAGQRQVGVLTRVGSGGTEGEAGWQWHSVTCDAATREPDGYVTVDTAGEVRLGGMPLSEVKDADVLTWVAKAVARFMATGQRSPVPGSLPAPTRLVPGTGMAVTVNVYAEEAAKMAEVADELKAKNHGK